MMVMIMKNQQLERGIFLITKLCYSLYEGCILFLYCSNYGMIAIMLC